jgi:hypothetical protein
VKCGHLVKHIHALHVFLYHIKVELCTKIVVFVNCTTNKNIPLFVSRIPGLPWSPTKRIHRSRQNNTPIRISDFSFVFPFEKALTSRPIVGSVHLYLVFDVLFGIQTRIIFRHTQGCGADVQYV